ncbi:MAG: pyridoxal 5'-phosphate synthase glutaminase subunit PdxT [Candidatus Methanomethylophilaceae archaeon]
MVVGVLAVQGAFAEHEKMLKSIGIGTFQIRNSADLDKDMEGLVLPGGESTVMGKLILELGMFDILKKKISEGLPTFGTCAGLLLLAQHIDNDNRTYFATMPIIAKRNAYGRQLGSFSTVSDFKGVGKVPMEFIRAPYIESLGSDAVALATVNGKIVAARYENQLVTAFHPELTNDTSVHEYFADMIFGR